MAPLWGHATDRPGRWKEPRAFAATDHTAQRTRQGRGRHSIRRRVGRQCVGRHGGRGSLIPHAGAIGALLVAMIEAPFRTPAVSGAGGGDRASARGDATGRRAVRVPAITRGAQGKQGAAGAAHLLAQRHVHGVASAATTAPWTYAPFRGTTDHDGLGRPMASPRWSRGSGGSVRALTSALPAQRTRPARPPRRRPCTLTDPWTRRRAHRSLQNRADAVSHKRPPPLSSS